MFPIYRTRLQYSSLLHSAADALFKRARSAFQFDPCSSLGVALADFALLLKREACGIPTTDTDWLRGLFVLRTWLENRHGRS